MHKIISTTHLRLNINDIFDLSFLITGSMKLIVNLIIDLIMRLTLVNQAFLAKLIMQQMNYR